MREIFWEPDSDTRVHTELGAEPGLELRLPELLRHGTDSSPTSGQAGVVSSPGWVRSKAEADVN